MFAVMLVVLTSQRRLYSISGLFIQKTCLAIPNMYQTLCTENISNYDKNCGGGGGARTGMEATRCYFTLFKTYLLFDFIHVNSQERVFSSQTRYNYLNL